MKQHGLTLETIKTFEIGFAKSNALKGLKNKHLKSLQDASIINEKGNEIYWNRLTFPIKNELGQIVGFNGRQAYDDSDKNTPKYLLPNANRYFNKTNLVYNLDKAKDAIKQENNVYIVEGIFDVMAFYQLGIKNAVATLGTELSEKQLELIALYTDNFILAYDGDVAGFTATLKAGKVISDYMKQTNLSFKSKDHTSIIKFDEGKDGADYINNPQAFEKVINEQLTFPQFCSVKFKLEDTELSEKYQQAYADFKEKILQSTFKTKNNTPSKLTQEVMEKVSIVEIVEKYASDKLIKRGKNFVTRCILPNHLDENPSFNIIPEKNIFKCFSCGQSGNVIHLVAEMEKVSYLEARDILRKDYQIGNLDNKQKFTNKNNSKAKQELLAFTQECFQYHLKNVDNQIVINHLNLHGITNEDIERFGIGYVPRDTDGLVILLKNNGFSLELACELRILKQTENGFSATINGGITLAKKNKFGKLTGFEKYPAEDVDILKATIDKLKNDHLQLVKPIMEDTSTKQVTTRCRNVNTII